MIDRTMLRLAVAGAAALIACLTAGPALGSPLGRATAVNRVNRPGARVASPTAATTLFSQMTDDTGFAFSSQIFDKADASDNSEAADDFTIPSLQRWNVTSISVVGQYFNCPGGVCGTSRHEVVTFYRGHASSPRRSCSR